MMRRAIATLLLALAAGAHADNVTPDQMAQFDKSSLEILTYRTVGCMREAVPERLSHGERDRNAIAQYAAETCGLPLGRFMVARMGLSQHQAATYLFAMGYEALKDARQ